MAGWGDLFNMDLDEAFGSIMNTDFISDSIGDVLGGGFKSVVDTVTQGGFDIDGLKGGNLISMLSQGLNIDILGFLGNTVLGLNHIIDFKFEMPTCSGLKIKDIKYKIITDIKKNLMDQTFINIDSLSNTPHELTNVATNFDLYSLYTTKTVYNDLNNAINNGNDGLNNYNTVSKPTGISENVTNFSQELDKGNLKYLEDILKEYQPEIFKEGKYIVQFPKETNPQVKNTVLNILLNSSTLKENQKNYFFYTLDDITGVEPVDLFTGDSGFNNIDPLILELNNSFNSKSYNFHTEPFNVKNYIVNAKSNPLISNDKVENLKDLHATLKKINTAFPSEISAIPNLRIYKGLLNQNDINNSVNKSIMSKFTTGDAVEFDITGFNTDDIIEYIKNNIKYGTLIKTKNNTMILVSPYNFNNTVIENMYIDGSTNTNTSYNIEIYDR
jgi:hypothetical protein